MPPDYLLNPTHPDNAGKTPFFISLGFSASNWDTLAAAFRKLADVTKASRSMESPHGRKYVLDGRLESPGGRTLLVRTIWIVDGGFDQPRLVTAYPRNE